MKLYRIFDDKDGQPHTLFHGVDGSRKLPLDEWIEAEVKPVKNGTGGKIYNSGFHVLKNKTDIPTFLKQFKNLENRVIVRVDIDEDAGLWPKSHSKINTILAKRMKISKRDWANRIKASRI